jgi:hypothetical protein
MRFADGDVGALDQMQCVLRPVGTFGVGDALVGTPAELRGDMTTAAQGNRRNGNGFNPPSLFGMQVGAPYLHGGGAATLESLFGATFAAHYQAISPNLFSESDPQARAAKVDEPPVPAAGAQGGSFCTMQ